MAQAIFYHKPDSEYDDVTGKQYHFPKTYLSRVEKTLGDWIVYYGPLPPLKGRYYSGIAKVDAIEKDPSKEGHYYAFLSQYLDFDRPLDYTENDGYEKKLVRPDGTVNGGVSVQAVRILDRDEYVAIVNAGLSSPDEWPDRYDLPTNGNQNESDRFEDGPQSPLIDIPGERTIVSQIVNRPFRDAKFRQHIRRIYDRTCAFTGLRLINGQGRPEVEAAHIIPVEKGGNDSVQNGIALSGTVHWMFDRGLLSLGDDYSILPSRHLNYDVSHLLNKDMKANVPSESRLRPHPHYLAWHRENVFKQ
ncbi:HNH endonuclease [Roseibium aggregatum]|uniref:HNH endonuclease n=1 Tax=Roseibium aggregatum TaxID=187304 RepID=A0A926S574_9HYPH|nr:HNH endonuclease [Roseibium aggregatum]MBD1547163.1 HNH endonuclease [Roseibium aggregatum]